MESRTFPSTGGSLAAAADGAELLHRQELTRIVVEHAADVVSLVDEDGINLYVSPAIRTVLGYAPEELLGTTPGFLHPDDLEVARDARRRALAGEPTYARLRMRHRDGHWVEIEGANVGVPGSDTAPPTVAIIARDISERVRVEERLRQVDRLAAVGRLAGGVAHDFNNVLTAIIGSTELLLEAEDPPDDWRETIEVIHRAAERAAMLTRELLSFGGRQVLQPQALGVNDVIRASERLLRSVLGEDTTYELHLGTHLPDVWVDPDQLQHALLDLALNARQSMPGGGHVVVSTARAAGGESVQIVVADDGEGMGGTVVDHAFEPFFTTRLDHSGLGLATVHGIVSQMGGTVELWSEPGRGTRVTILLPVTSTQPVALVEELEPSSAAMREAVLLVDDEEIVRRLVRRVLEADGYTVFEAADAEGALELAGTTRIDLIMSDVVMPGMDGHALVGELRRVLPDVPVILVSGYDEQSVLDAAPVTDQVDFLAKPFSPSELLAKVRAVLGDRPVR